MMPITPADIRIRLREICCRTMAQIHETQNHDLGEPAEDGDTFRCPTCGRIAEFRRGAWREKRD